jgi:hypothetical protein
MFNSCGAEKTPEQIKAEAAAKIEKSCKDPLIAMAMSEIFVKRQLK